MADIALVTADTVRVVESIEQMTLPAAAAITAGAPVRIDTNGKFTSAKGDNAANAKAYGIATRTVASGEACTAVAKGVLDGFALDSVAYGADLYVSDTTGRVGDTAGTTSVVLGQVVPGTATTLGTSFDKLFRVNR